MKDIMEKLKTYRKTVYFLAYTLAFLLTCLLIFKLFLTEHITFVWKIDGLNQHIQAYIYYSRWLRDIARHLIFDHRLEIPIWDFNMGYGADVMTTLNYYVLGEPLTLLLALVPSAYITKAYTALILLRFYLAGISFSCYCFYQRIENRLGIFCGAMVYVFSVYPLYYGIHHPFFLIPMIMLPLWLIGIDKIIRNESPVIFILSVFISLVSNFYFFYMTALLAVIYALFRYFALFRKEGARETVITMGKSLFYAVVGVMIGCVIFLPVLYLFSIGSRTAYSQTYSLFYDMSFLETIPEGFLTFLPLDNHTSLGYTWVPLVCIVLLFLRRRHLDLKIGFVLLTFFICCPYIGHVFNGFSYSSNRWTFGYTFLISLIVAVVFNDLLKSEKPYYKIEVAAAIAASLFLICQLSLGAREHFRVQISEKKEFMKDEKVQKHIQKAPESLFTSKKGWGRVTTTYGKTKRNVSILYGVPGTSFYWSLNDGEFEEGFDQVGIPYSGYNYRNLDERAVLNTLAGVKYYVLPSDKKGKDYLPYGYKKLFTRKKRTVYENRMALPFGYTYDSAIPKKEYSKLNQVEKENILLYGVLTDTPVSLPATQYTPTDREIDYDIRVGKRITIKGDEWTVHKKKGKKGKKKKTKVAKLSYEGIPDSENYLAIDVQYRKSRNKAKRSAAKMVITNEHSVKKKLGIWDKKSTRYIGRDRFLVNTGYGQYNRLKLKFSHKGIYNIKYLKIICQPLEGYEEAVKRLKRDHMEAVRFRPNRFEGKIFLKEPRFLVVPVAYSRGWKAFVDGEEAKVQRAQHIFMGLMLKPGNHRIRFVYHSPYLGTGLLISLIGQFMLLIIIIRRKKHHGNTINRFARL